MKNQPPVGCNDFVVVLLFSRTLVFVFDLVKKETYYPI